MSHAARTSALTLALLSALVAGSTARAAEPATGPAAPVQWKLVREAPVLPGTMVVAFLDERFAHTAGCPAPLNRSFDGGEHWSYGFARDLCRSALEVVPGLALSGGNGGDLRRSTDEGVHWERAHPFGESYPHQPRFLSFLDDKVGAIATDLDLGLTDDGGRTWQRLLPPAQAEDLAAVSVSKEDGRLVLRVLDEAGAIWRSADGGKTWASAPSPLQKRILASAEQVRQMPRGPMAALRFEGAVGVLAATLDDGEALSGRVYRTRDGGATWAEERLSAPFHGAVVTLSRDGKILSALDTGAATVRVYRAE
jgi:photosystem II stability/assembly factor-like uncharacterized protein